MTAFFYDCNFYQIIIKKVNRLAQSLAFFVALEAVFHFLVP